MTAYNHIIWIQQVRWSRKVRICLHELACIRGHVLPTIFLYGVGVSPIHNERLNASAHAKFYREGQYQLTYGVKGYNFLSSGSLTLTVCPRTSLLHHVCPCHCRYRSVPIICFLPFARVVTPQPPLCFGVESSLKGRLIVLRNKVLWIRPTR